MTEEHEHVWVFGSYACVTCGELDQMTFEDVVDLEVMEGDQEYTQWLAAGRPRIDSAVTVARARGAGAGIEDVLPGL